MNKLHNSKNPKPHIPLDKDGLFCPMIFDSPSDTNAPTPSSTSAPAEEELRNLKEQEALSLALCPHDKDGFAVPLIPVGDSKYAREVGTLNFPVITPDSEGLSAPILFGKDFVDGQYPEGSVMHRAALIPCGSPPATAWITSFLMMRSSIFPSTSNSSSSGLKVPQRSCQFPPLQITAVPPTLRRSLSPQQERQCCLSITS